MMKKYSPPGAMAAEPLIDAKTGQAVHQVDRVSDERPALGRRLFRTVAFAVIASVLVGAAVAWQFYSDGRSKHMVGAGKLHGIVASTKSPSTNVVPVELASKTTRDPCLLPSTQGAVLPHFAHCRASTVTHAAQSSAIAAGHRPAS